MLRLHRVYMDVPQEVRDALAMVRKVDPSALVAGGCLRDTYFRTPLKDIDVFVGPGFSLRMLHDVLPPKWTAGIEFPASHVAEYREHFGPRVLEVFSACRADPDSLLGDEPFGLPVQIIQIAEEPKIRGLLDGFDFGFCQIALDMQGEQVGIFVTEQFLHDAQHNMATSMLPLGDPRLPRSQERAYRLAEKYPGRRFLFPLDTRTARAD